MEKNDTIDKTKRVEDIKEKIRQRVRDGGDPRMAQWQGTLESVVANFAEKAVPGDIVAAETPSPDEIALFDHLRAALDITPFVLVLFLPERLAARLKTTDPIRPLVSPDILSRKVLITAAASYDRILIAELAEVNPGIDILENGALLGSYNYGSSDECIRDIPNIVLLHFKQPRWERSDYIRYTENWFHRSVMAPSPGPPINPNNSYIHHPVLLDLPPVEAIFQLMRATLARLCEVPGTVIAMANAANLYAANTVEIQKDGLRDGDPNQTASLSRYLESRLLWLLNHLRRLDILSFNAFSDHEQGRFRELFTQTVTEIRDNILDKLRNA